MIPQLRRRLVLKRRAILKTLFSMEFNLSTREDHLDRAEMLCLLKIRAVRREVQASLNRLGAAMISN